MAQYRSSFEQTDDGPEPDYLYYNADIVNNRTSDSLAADPAIVFDETRDKALLRNASNYYFSIIRFTMDGANRNLPLFIPTIQDGTGQSNADLTVYRMAVPRTQTFVAPAGVVSVNPPARPIVFTPEFVNEPLPRTMANENFVGQWSITGSYKLGNIVSDTAANQYGEYLGPFWQIQSQSAWNNQQQYSVGSIVQYNGTIWVLTAPLPATPPYPQPYVGSPYWTAGVPVGTPTTNRRFWVSVPATIGQTQDVTSKYYWVTTYAYFVNLWNLTMYDPAQNGAVHGAASTCAYQDTYNALYAQYIAQGGPAGSFPYPTFGDFVNEVYPPQMRYDSPTQKFVIQCDSAGFGQRLTAWGPVVVPLLYPPQMKLFFNTNMWNLFSNYPNITHNDPNLPAGYAYELLVVNKNYQNTLDERLQPFEGTAPLGFTPLNPDGTELVPNALNRVYWLLEQDYGSTTSVWSPVESIVFLTNLLPVLAEATAAPVYYDNSTAGNVGVSTATAPSAFQPIITDIALDTTIGGAEDYRKFIYYAPSAEYRLSDFCKSKTPIQQIQIVVKWKNRLSGEYTPITMTNLSTVSIKVMFKHIDRMT